MSFRNPITVKPGRKVPSPILPGLRVPVTVSPGATISSHSMVASKASMLLALYVFLVYSRIPEVIGALVGNIRIALILMAILTVVTFLRNQISLPTSAPAICAFLFTGWMVACVPASVWPGGSVRTIVFVWLIALLVFWFSSSLAWTLKDCELMMHSFAWGILTILVIYLAFGRDFGNRMGMVIAGTLGNANMLALQILFGLPFCLYFLLRAKNHRISAFLNVFGLLGGLYLVSASGSRSALISLAIACVILFLRSSGMVKVPMLVVFGLLFITALAFLPKTTLARYLTLFSDDPNLVSMSEEVIAARESSAARRYHLQQGIELTFSHPIFGVGPGQFKVAAADLSNDKNERAPWLETHNSYVQVSSETGVPGLILYCGMLLASIKRLISVHRRARRRQEWSMIADMCFCVLLSFVVTTINAFFGSVAYQIYMPLLCGFSVALCRISENAMNSTLLPQTAAPAPMGSNYAQPIRNSFAMRPLR